MESTPTAQPASVDALIASSRFVVAHRGSGDNWPEHSLIAYESALAAGADAVEISVCATVDGVLICHHDTSALRLLGVDAEVSDLSWPEVRELRLDARRWLGPETPLEPVARFEDVLRALGPSVLAFVEDKQGTNTSAILDLLDAQERSRERFVWKQWAGAKQVEQARERGYRTWGYFEEGQLARLAEFSELHDLLGIPVRASDETIMEVVATGKPVMSWEVHFRDDVTRLQSLGVAGLMCANVPYVLGGAVSSTDAFASGRRAAGDLPALFETYGWGAQPRLVPERASLRIERAGATSYLMGSLAEPGRPVRTVSATIGWPEAVPPTGSCGVAIGLTGDGPGGDQQVGAASGWLLEYDVQGVVRVVELVDGARRSVVATSAVDVPFPGASALVVVSSSERDGIVVEFTAGSEDSADTGETVVLSVPDVVLNGPWVRLLKSYDTAHAVEFSAVAARS